MLQSESAAAPAPGRTDAAASLRTVLKSQYHAALAMLRQAIEQCPAALWTDSRSRAVSAGGGGSGGRGCLNPFWRVAYHTLYFTHLYLQPNEGTFRPWSHHQTGIQDLDDIPAPPHIADLTELPHRPPQTGVPYTKAQVLEYWGVCDQMVNRAVDALDLSAGESGFSWYKVPKIEHQIINVRHIQHHAGQLADRVRSAANIGIDWVGARREQARDG